MLLSLFAACDLFGASDGSGETWIDQPPACEADPYAWSDDLVSYLSTGSGDGTFDFDPVDEPRSGIAGNYDADGGDYAYEISFADDYFIVGSSVADGTGTAWHNGDLDVEYSSTVEDKLGVKSTISVRVERIGCDESRWSWDPSAAVVEYSELIGSYSADGFEWAVTLENATDTGVFLPDGSSTEAYEDDTRDENYTNNLDGTRDREFKIQQDPYTYNGDETRNFDGSLASSYDIEKSGDAYCSVNADYQYDGDGEERWICGEEEFTCEINLDDEGKCTYECDDGQSGRC